MLAGPLADASGRPGQMRRQAAAQASTHADMQPANGQAPVKALPMPALRALPGGVGCCSRARVFRPPGCLHHPGGGICWFGDAARSCMFCSSRLLCVCVSLLLAFAQPLADSVRPRWRVPMLASTAFVDGNGEPARGSLCQHVGPCQTPTKELHCFGQSSGPAVQIRRVELGRLADFGDGEQTPGASPPYAVA